LCDLQKKCHCWLFFKFLYFFRKWFSMILWSMMDDLMMHVCTLYGMMKQIKKTLFVSFIFPFFINLRNVGGVMHMHTLWIIDDVWHAMIFFLNVDDDACMNAWMLGWDSWDSYLLFFHFSFFHKSKKCWRSYAYAHVINHWWYMTCYDFLFKPRRWCMHGCVDAWVKFALFKKMNYSCMHDLVWCTNFSFAFFLKTNSNWFSFHCYF